MLIRGALLGICLLGAGVATAHEHPAAAQKAPLGASAVFAPDGRLWLVTASADRVLLRHSDDLGRTLSPPLRVNADAEPVSASGENRPKIALGPQGEILVSWTGPLTKPYTGRIRFARSLDGGAHFSAPITVHHDRAEITHRFDALAVDARGDVLVAWIDKRDLVAAEAREQAYAGAAIWYAWSRDRGKTFEPERKLADHSCECCRIALAPATDGAIAAFWRHVFDGGIRDHAFATIGLDDVRDAATRATFDGGHIEGCPHHGPALAIGADGTRHAVWFSAANDEPRIHYGQLDPGHAPKHRAVIAEAGASHADIAVSGSTVWVAWNRISAAGMDLMLRESRDVGANFGDPRMLATTRDAAGSPQLLLHDGRAFVAWNTGDGFRLVATDAGP
jgi:hypothetical protein